MRKKDEKCGQSTAISSSRFGLGDGWLDWSRRQSHIAKGQHGISIMLVLGVPILWCLWAAYAFSTSNYTRPKYSLTLLWTLIDAGILVAMLGGWNSNPGLGKSQGTEMVVYVMYCPVITPFGLVLYWIDDLTSAVLSLVKVRNFDIKAGAAEALSIWLSFSLIAAVQSYSWRRAFVYSTFGENDGGSQRKTER